MRNTVPAGQRDQSAAALPYTVGTLATGRTGHGCGWRAVATAGVARVESFLPRLPTGQRRSRRPAETARSVVRAVGVDRREHGGCHHIAGATWSRAARRHGACRRARCGCRIRGGRPPCACRRWCARFVVGARQRRLVGRQRVRGAATREPSSTTATRKTRENRPIHESRSLYIPWWIDRQFLPFRTTVILYSERA